jgi:hypothetical protein
LEATATVSDFVWVFSAFPINCTADVIGKYSRIIGKDADQGACPAVLERNPWQPGSAGRRVLDWQSLLPAAVTAQHGDIQNRTGISSSQFSRPGKSKTEGPTPAE